MLVEFSLIFLIEYLLKMLRKNMEIEMLFGVFICLNGLTLPMLRLLLSKAQGSKPFHVVFIG